MGLKTQIFTVNVGHTCTSRSNLFRGPSNETVDPSVSFTIKKRITLESSMFKRDFGWSVRPILWIQSVIALLFQCEKILTDH